MNAADIAIIAVIAIAVGFALRHIHRMRKNGCSCGCSEGNCSGCSGNCASCGMAFPSQRKSYAKKENRSTSSQSGSRSEKS